MRDAASSGRRPRSLATWIRHNVIEAAPLWAELYRSVLANVRIHWERP